MPPDPRDESCLPSYAQSHSSPDGSSGLLSPTATVVEHQQDGRLSYSGNPSTALMSPVQQYVPSLEYPQCSPALSYAPAPTAAQGDAVASPQAMPHASYRPFGGDEASREDSWSPPDTCVTHDYHAVEGSQSPILVQSPTVTASELASELAYNTQYSSSIHTVETSYGSDQLYMFSPSRSVSPTLTQASTASSTSISVSSTSFASMPYQFTFPEGSAVQDRPEFGGFHRQFALQGGTAHIAETSRVGDNLRHKFTNRHNPQSLPTAPSLRDRGEGTAYHEDDTSDPPADPSAISRHRHNMTPDTQPSRAGTRSPSPGPKVSGTLAIIKAQAFGALRRTRGRTRTSSEGLAKAAVDALSTHGVGLGLVTGPATKRQRTRHHDDKN